MYRDHISTTRHSNMRCTYKYRHACGTFWGIPGIPRHCTVMARQQEAKFLTFDSAWLLQGCYVPVFLYYFVIISIALLPGGVCPVQPPSQ